MALNGNYEAVVGLDAFHRAIFAARGLLQSLAELLDRLVVKAVDADLMLACRLTQLRRRVDLDRVR